MYLTIKAGIFFVMKECISVIFKITKGKTLFMAIKYFEQSKHISLEMACEKRNILVSM